MKSYILTAFFSMSQLLCIGQNTSQAKKFIVEFSEYFESNAEDRKGIMEIFKLMEYETTIIEKQDTTGMENFYPKDMIVTEANNDVFVRSFILELVKTNVLKYSGYLKKIDFIHAEGIDLLVVLGNETTTLANDADSPDAGKVIKKRFTEVWKKREGEWKKISRHASFIVKP